MTFDQHVSFYVILILLAAFCTGALLSLFFKLRDQERDADKSRGAFDLIREEPPLPVVLVRTRAPLTQDELRTIAAEWIAEDGPTLHLVEDALDHFLADAVAGVCREDVTPDQRVFAAAALDATRRFRAYLFSLKDAEPEGREFKK